MKDDYRRQLLINRLLFGIVIGIALVLVISTEIIT